MLESMGISVSSATTRGAPGQQEIDLRYADALSTADNIMTFRLVVKGDGAGARGGRLVHAQSRSRSTPGRACTHLSLFEGDTNAFYEPGAQFQCPRSGGPSPRACWNTPARSVRSPTSGSIPAKTAGGRRRGAGLGLLGPQQPVGHDARSDVHKPHKGGSTRVELRTLDAACNPYWRSR